MVIVRVVGLPSTIRGLTVPDTEGNYNIFLNKNLTYEMQVDTYQHEFNHVRMGHFCSTDPVVVLEKKAKYQGIQII